MQEEPNITRVSIESAEMAQTMPCERGACYAVDAQSAPQPSPCRWHLLASPAA
jgi:hypothetical protein